MRVWCTCRLIPSCEYQLCSYPAEMSALVPVSWERPLRLGARFYCIPHWESIVAWWEKPIRGIDRPEDAPEDWRPSLEEMFRHARIAISFENRNKQPPLAPPTHHMDAYWRRYEEQRGFTRPQREAMARHRELCRKYSVSSPVCKDRP
jgi:hypothetical protein